MPPLLLLLALFDVTEAVAAVEHNNDHYIGFSLTPIILCLSFGFFFTATFPLILFASLLCPFDIRMLAGGSNFGNPIKTDGGNEWM